MSSLVAFATVAALALIGWWSQREMRRRHRSWSALAERDGWRRKGAGRVHHVEGRTRGKRVELALEDRQSAAPGFESARLEVDVEGPVDRDRVERVVEALQRDLDVDEARVVDGSVMVRGPWPRFGATPDAVRATIDRIADAADDLCVGGERPPPIEVSSRRSLGDAEPPGEIPGSSQGRRRTPVDDPGGSSSTGGE